MNIFDEIVSNIHANDTRLGVPSTDLAHFDRRMAAMASMRNGNGFPAPKKTIRVFSDGKTRGDRKRALRAAANARVSETRDPQFMHSSARRRTDDIALAA